MIPAEKEKIVKLFEEKMSALIEAKKKNNELSVNTLNHLSQSVTMCVNMLKETCNSATSLEDLFSTERGNEFANKINASSGAKSSLYIRIGGQIANCAKVVFFEQLKPLYIHPEIIPGLEIPELKRS